MKLDTIIYCRVSTDEQADKGFGRDHQKDVLTKYCEIKKYGIAKEYLEDYSAKDFNRPEWKKLESFVKANKKNIDRVLFTKWDRFSRNMVEALQVIKKFKNWGVELNAIEQPLDMSISNNKLMLNIYLTMPEIENDNISSRTRDGLYKAAKSGAFTGTPPFGYDRIRYDKIASLTPNDNSLMVVDIFEKVSLGVESLEGIRKEFVKKGYNRCKQSFYNMLKNRAYLGQVRVPEHKKDDAYWIDGLHEPIIDEKLFQEVQIVLDGRIRNAKPPSKKNEMLPLRSFLVCEYCGGNLTGSISKGNGGKYGYYHCRGKCKNRIPTKIAENLLIEEVLDKIKVNPNVLELYKQIIIDVQKTFNGTKKDRAAEVEGQINDTYKLIESIEDKYALELLTQNIFNRMHNRYEADIMSLKAELIELKEAKTLTNKTIDKAINTIQNIPKLYCDSNYDEKIKILGLLIPEKLKISKNNCRTNKDNIVIELLSRVSKGSQGMDTKKAIKNDGLSSFAPPLGLEPNIFIINKIKS